VEHLLLIRKEKSLMSLL